MSFLSKLLGGDKNAEKAAKDLLNGLFGNAQPNQTAAPKTETPVSTPVASQTPAQSGAPSGFSWGEEMPAEENQYNYNGTYEQYFEHIFGEDFPVYRFEKTYINDYGKRRVAYTFYKDAVKVLAVELMPESSEAKKYRNECRKANIPYLRFYIDHDGWWNTRSYITERMREVMNG